MKVLQHLQVAMTINENKIYLQCLDLQCSPYQAVTGKIYRLKQHFLPPATSWSVTKIK